MHIKKHSLPTYIGSGLFKITRPSTRFPTKKLPPTKVAIERGKPSVSEEAAMVEKISGAPLPRASRVTPAKFSDIWSILLIWASAGER